VTTLVSRTKRDETRPVTGVLDVLERTTRTLPLIHIVSVEIDGPLIATLAYLLLSIRHLRGKEFRITYSTIKKLLRIRNRSQISKVRKALVAFGIINPTNGDVNWDMADRFLSTLVEIVDESEIRKLIEKPPGVKGGWK